MVDGGHSTAGPLAGWRVVVTRSAQQANALSEALRAQGAEPVPYPTIAFAPPDNPAPFDAALRRLLDGRYSWLILTSVTGVERVSERLSVLRNERTNGSDAPPLPPFQIAVVGAATATACTRLLGRAPALVPEKFVAEALAEALSNMQGQHVLLAQAEMARPLLAEHLEEAGAEVDMVVAYRTVPASGGADVPGLLAAGNIHAITFTSSSTVRFFVERVGPAALEHARQTVIACIGPITAQAAEEAGMKPDIVAEPSTIDALVGALVAQRTHKRPG